MCELELVLRERDGFFTERLDNAGGVLSENSQRHSLEQQIVLALILSMRLSHLCNRFMTL